MKTLAPRKSTLLFIASLVMAAVGYADIIGPWPTDKPHMWNNQPIPNYVAGTNFIGVPLTIPAGLYVMWIESVTKKTSWLPYGDTYAEKMSIGQLNLPPGTKADAVHAKVFDPYGTTGKNGWAVILMDDAGRIMDFGIRGFFASKQIKAHEYDGVGVWTNGPTMTRAGGGNSYYTMDFTNNADGTITYTIVAEELGAAGGSLYWTNTLTSYVTNYGDITKVYLNVMTPDASAATQYKWTEFSVSPQVFSPPTLHIAPTNTAEVALWWLSPWTTNFVVQTNADLSTTSWGAVTNTPTDDGTNISVTLPIEPGNQFFRLKN